MISGYRFFAYITGYEAEHMLELAMLMCPKCGAPLDCADKNEVLCVCGEAYQRLPTGGMDFLQSGGFPDFKLDKDDMQQHALLEKEGAGVATRINEFIIPMIRRFASCAARNFRSLTVLDCGCGGGLSVDIMKDQGLEAWGIDAGRARHRQWQQRLCRNSLISANALRIPFADASFDVVLSFGLIEHLGIHEEESADGYHAYRLTDCHAQRRLFVRELVRVMKHDGFLVLDHPNGAFPADFWHGGVAGSIRWHKSFEDMLPRFKEIETYFGDADSHLRLISLSPSRRLSFNKVGAHWYGRVFAPAMKLWLRMMELRPLSFLARSFLNPYLITVATRRLDFQSWV